MEIIPNKDAVAKILSDRGVILAYLFGSRATGSSRVNSDYDIAVYLSSKLSMSERFDERLKLSEQLSRALGYSADVTVLNDTHSVLLRYAIINEGKLLYVSDEDSRVTLECQILSDYFDFEPFLEAYGKNYVQTHAQ